MNHLFAQGKVAMETLRFDTEAQEKFLAKVDELAPGHPLDRTFRSLTLIYGILLKDWVPLTPGSLLAFAKVSLLHAVTALEVMGVRVEIISISRTRPPGWSRRREEQTRLPDSRRPVTVPAAPQNPSRGAPRRLDSGKIHLQVWPTPRSTP
ncbi:DUF6119 family protein [Nonomuraea insulae]|uniref:DUF6119 family protein n=1 Tax=Nonomuraea insulae TaxID=1616787 RepID=A0ABW1CEV9_9ACTN